MGAFKIQECHKKSIADICTYYHNSPGDLIKILYSVQKELGFLPEDVQREVARILKISVARVYGVVSFYSFFTMTPKGRHPISVCMGTACYVKGAPRLAQMMEEELGVKIGETTADGKFTLSAVRCVGACSLAPVFVIGEDTYGRVDTRDKMSAILKRYE